MGTKESRMCIKDLALAATAIAGLLGASCTTAGPDAAATTTTARTGDEQSARRALEKTYEANRQALLSREVSAVLALRTPDFHVVTPDGATHGPEEMADFSRNLLENVQQWVELSFTPENIRQEGNEISADVRQHSIRLQRRDGAVRRIENWVTQRETWVKTPQGLRHRRVDNIRDQRVLIDGKPRL
jgi:ketosteroid isomerase-like protein